MNVPAPPERRLVMAAAAVLALAWVIIARTAGPSDLFDQSQPRTISYTTDIVANGRWILPVERGDRLATKPPLYNWLAAGPVKVLGFDSEFGHKLPSVAALVVSFLVVVGVGGRIARGVGAAAALMFVSNYTIFKLGYLARPDMVLSLWMLLGWALATSLIAADPADRSLRRVGFWACVALAAGTKGPAALPLLLYAAIAPRLVSGGRSVSLGWWWGLPLSGVLIGAWVFAVWRENPGHLVGTLWFDEVYGRITGIGPEGSQDGPIALIRDAPLMPFYYLVRFAPWSLLSVFAVVRLCRREEDGVRRWRTMDLSGRWLAGAALFVVIQIVAFSLSAGKRADYLAPAFGPGALLAGWWLIDMGARRLQHAAVVAACVILSVMTWRNVRQPAAPVPGFGDSILAFAGEAGGALASDRRPVVFCWVGDTYLQALLGYSEIETDGPPAGVLARREPFWLVVGGLRPAPGDVPRWLARAHPGWTATVGVRSVDLPDQYHWPKRVTLYRVERPDDAEADG